MADDMTSRDVIDVSSVDAVEEAVSAIPQKELNRLTDDLIAAFKTVYDPEIPVDIYELGLIYKVDIDDDFKVDIDMTLTAPGCPVAGDMPGWIENAARTVEGVKDVEVRLTFDPPWDISRMSDEAAPTIKYALNEGMRVCCPMLAPQCKFDPEYRLVRQKNGWIEVSRSCGEDD